MGPFVRRAFACGRPEPLLASLRAAVRDREAEIEELCRAHFHYFIRAVDDLRSLLADADALKGSLSASHSALLSSAAPLLASALASSRRCYGCPSDLWRATSAGITLLLAWSPTALLVHDASPLLWLGNFQCPLLCSILKAAQSNITCSILKAVLCAVLALANQ